MEEKVNILVVDDLPDKRLAFREVLEELDENLVLVASGAEALGELLEREFAVIVLDVNMPDIDGIETAELIRKHGTHVAHADHLRDGVCRRDADGARLRARRRRLHLDARRAGDPAQQSTRVRGPVPRAAARGEGRARRGRASRGRGGADAAPSSSRSRVASVGSRSMLESSMERLLEVLVPSVGGCALLSRRRRAAAT